MTLTTQTPAQIDTEAARIYNAKMRIAQPIAQRNITARELAKYRRHGAPCRHLESRLVKDERRARIARAIIARIERELEAPLDEEYARRGGWNRFFMVGGGHLHLGRQCSSLRPTTLLGWMPEQSGKDEKEVVAVFGEGACTKCFPSAPVWYTKPATTEAPAVGEKCTNKTFHPTPDNMNRRRAYRYGKCTLCGTGASITTADNLRAHKVKA